MWNDSVEVTIRNFVENLENSLSIPKLDSILVALKSHGLSSREAILRIFHAYVSKIRSLSALQPQLTLTTTEKIHYPRISVRQGCAACCQHQCGKNLAQTKSQLDPKTKPSMSSQIQTYSQLIYSSARSRRPPTILTSGRISSQPQLVHFGRAEQESLPHLGPPPLQRKNKFKTQSLTSSLTYSSDALCPSPNTPKNSENFSNERSMYKSAFFPLNGVDSAEFAHSVIKNLRQDVAEKMKKYYSHEPRHSDTMNKTMQTLFNPKERLAGGGDPGLCDVKKIRLQILLGKMADIEAKINAFKEKALTANRLQEVIYQLRVVLNNERQLCNVKLESAAGEFRRQIEMVESQVDVCQKERAIYEKLAKKLEYELHQSEKEKFRIRRHAENLETKINCLLENIYVQKDRLPSNKETGIRSMESISDELVETKAALKNIERKHDELLKKLDEAIKSKSCVEVSPKCRSSEED